MKFHYVLSAIFLAIALETTATELSVGQQLPIVSGWTLVGTGTQPEVHQGTITVPAGAQIFRTFAGSDLVVSFRTRPTIGPDQTGWPVMELGAAALVFSRNGTAGKILLVIGDEPPRELTGGFTLNEAGQSIDELAVSFSLQRSSVSVEIAGTTQQFPITATSDLTSSVVISAGELQGWAFASLTISSDQSTLPSSAQASQPSGVSTPAFELRPTKPPVTTLPELGRLLPNLVEDPLKLPGRASPTASISSGGLRIFTPPAFHLGRVDEVRTAANAGK